MGSGAPVARAPSQQNRTLRFRTVAPGALATGALDQVDPTPA